MHVDRCNSDLRCIHARGEPSRSQETARRSVEYRWSISETDARGAQVDEIRAGLFEWYGLLAFAVATPDVFGFRDTSLVSSGVSPAPRILTEIVLTLCFSLRPFDVR